MNKRDITRSAAGIVAASAAVAAVGYAVLAGRAWVRFGGAPRARTPDEQDPLLDRFVPRYDIVERHHIAVSAPAAVTLECARTLDMTGTWLSRAIFKSRELMLCAEPAPPPAGGLMSQMLQIGWGVLAEEPGREMVFGAATRPWEPNPVFRTIPAEAFAAFDEPGYVKIAFTLRADSVGDDRSIFRTETRAVATDASSRRAFRRYWSLVSPGVGLIRVAMLRPVKTAAERGVDEAGRIHCAAGSTT